MSTEPTIFEKSRSGRVGVQMPACDVPVVDMDSLLPGVALRAGLPLPSYASRKRTTALTRDSIHWVRAR